MFGKRLHPLYELEGAIGAESGVDTTQVAAEPSETVIESGAEKEVAAEPNNYEKAFAKRLQAERDKWQKDNEDKYKDYETLKKTTSYFQQRHGYTDLMAMNEDIELAELQDRASKENVPPEVLKRIDQLEAEAAEGKQLKEQHQKEQQAATYFSTMDKFLEGKGVEAKDLNQFMIDNQISYNPEDMTKSFNVALKAMKAEQLDAREAEFASKQEQFEKDAVRKYLESKKAPRAEGKGAAAVATSAPKNWQEADARALARIQSANKQL